MWVEISIDFFCPWVIEFLKTKNISILIVDKSLKQLLDLADKFYIVEKGKRLEKGILLRIFTLLKRYIAEEEKIYLKFDEVESGLRGWCCALVKGWIVNGVCVLYFVFSPFYLVFCILCFGVWEKGCG